MLHSASRPVPDNNPSRFVSPIAFVFFLKAHVSSHGTVIDSRYWHRTPIERPRDCHGTAMGLWDAVTYPWHHGTSTIALCAIAPWHHGKFMEPIATKALRNQFYETRKSHESCHGHSMKTFWNVHQPVAKLPCKGHETHGPWCMKVT